MEREKMPNTVIRYILYISATRSIYTDNYDDINISDKYLLCIFPINSS